LGSRTSATALTTGAGSIDVETRDHRAPLGQRAIDRNEE